MPDYTIIITPAEFAYLQRAIGRDILDLEEMSSSMIEGLVDYSREEMDLAGTLDRKLRQVESDQAIPF